MADVSHLSLMYSDLLLPVREETWNQLVFKNLTWNKGCPCFFLYRAAFEASHPILGTTALVGIAAVGEELAVDARGYVLGSTMKGSLYGGGKT